MGSDQFEYEAMHDRETLRNLLQSLIDGLDRDQLTFKSGRSRIDLKPGNLLNVQIRAKKRDDKSKLSLKLEWREGHEKFEGPAALEILS